VDRDAALRRMQQALADCEVVGVTTNAAFLRRLVMTDSFANAKLDTALIEREQAALAPRQGAADPALWALAAVAAVSTEPAASVDARDPHSPWQARDGWRLGQRAARRLTLEQGGTQQVVAVEGHGESFDRGGWHPGIGHGPVAWRAPGAAGWRDPAPCPRGTRRQRVVPVRQ